MSENRRPLSNRWLFRVLAFSLLGLILLARIGYGHTFMKDAKHAILQGSIHAQPSQPIAEDQVDKIQPGTPIKLSVTVENKGQQSSPAGELLIRYAFAKPLDQEEDSIIFETEKQSLPALEPGKKIDISFKKTHKSPSISDFVRHDWPMREYQAIALVDNKENVIGTLAITFSAYYYPGIKKELPFKISDSEPALNR